MPSERESTCRLVTILKLGHLARLVATVLAALVLLVGEASYAAQQTIEWFDEVSCRYKIRFDPKKYDATRIKNTADFIFSGYLRDFPLSERYLRPDDPGVDEYRAACTRHGHAIESLDLVDLPGLEDYRRLLLEQLQDWCDFGVALSRGAVGDTDALRSFKPSAPNCSHYVDALEGKTDLRQVWRELITSRCRDIYKPEACRSHFLAAEGKPDETERIKRDVLTYGWQNCSSRYLKTGNSVAADVASLRQQLDAKFTARFRITRAPCDD